MFPFESHAAENQSAATFDVALSIDQHQRTVFQSMGGEPPSTRPPADTLFGLNHTAPQLNQTNGCEISYSSPTHQSPLTPLLGGDCDNLLNQTVAFQVAADQGAGDPSAALVATRIRYNETNFSEFEQVWLVKSWQEILLRVTFVVPILLLGILGNLTIIYSICKFKKFRTKPTNIFILNMAIADLLTTIVCPLAALFTNIYQFYVLGAFMCRLEGFIKITCLLVSAYSLILLSLDWLLSVVRPFRRPMSLRRSWLTIASIWLISILMASPLFVWRHLRQRQWRDLLEVWCCELIQYTKYYWLGITFFLIYLPTLIMTIVLVCILAQMDKFEAKLRRETGAAAAAAGRRRQLDSTASRTEQQLTAFSATPTTSNSIFPTPALPTGSTTPTIKSQASSQQHNASASCHRPHSHFSKSINMKYRRRIMKILFTYLLTSMLCWTPLQFTIIYRHFRSEPVPAFWFFELVFFAQLSASLSSAMNPIIFGFLSQPFRQIVTKSWMFRLLYKLRSNGNNGGAGGGENKGHQHNQNHQIPMNLRNHNHLNHYAANGNHHLQHQQQRAPRHLVQQTPNARVPKRTSSQSRTTRDHFVQEEPKLTIETTTNEFHRPHKSRANRPSSSNNHHHQTVQLKRVSFQDNDRDSLIDSPQAKALEENGRENAAYDATDERDQWVTVKLDEAENRRETK